PFVTGTPPFRAPNDFGSPEARQYLIGLAAGNPLSQPDRRSPVEELEAIGFGTAAHRDLQAVQGKGVWVDNQWKVVLSRSLRSQDVGAAQFNPDTQIPTAFAVWNGANQEVGARKQLSASVGLQVMPKREFSPPRTPYTPIAPRPWGWEAVFVGLGMLVVIVAAILGWARGSRRGQRG
ncbi:MAG: hypothetical protein IT307_17590, partial [Chloroflexi bacterium]|nr:hypothetical protein [Chloroflexota bacterium]